MAALQYVPYTRKVARLKAPETVGEHIFKKRRENGHTRRELGELFGTDAYTVMNWESGRTKSVPARLMPAIISYLGYNPEPRPDRIGDQLRWKRRALGWTTTEAARNNSVDPATIEAWQRLDRWPAYPRFREFLQEFLDMPNEQLAGRIRQVRPPHVRKAPPRLLD